MNVYSLQMFQLNLRLQMNFYTLQSSLQILLSAVLDHGTSHAGNLKSEGVLITFIEGFFHEYQSHRMCLNVYMLLVWY